MCQDFHPTSEALARSALLFPGPRPLHGPTVRLGPRSRKTPPFPVAYSIPRPTTGGGRDQGGLRKLINQVPARPPGGGEGRGGSGGRPSDRRAQVSRRATFHAPSRRLRHWRPVVRREQPPPARPGLRQVSGDPREEETPPCGLGKPAVLAARVPASSACSFGVSSVRNPLSGFWRQLRGERAAN